MKANVSLSSGTEPNGFFRSSCSSCRSACAFSRTSYLTHRITNAVTEGLNAKIQWIEYSSRGFRDRERFKLAIYFHCGGLDLEPRR